MKITVEDGAFEIACSDTVFLASWVVIQPWRRWGGGDVDDTRLT